MSLFTKPLTLILALLFIGAQVESLRASTPAVSSPEPIATAAAAAVLERGGNAIDAAITTAFVLAVTLPDAGNIGGGGFMTLYVEGEPLFLDYRETAPSAANKDMYLNEDGSVETSASVTGGRAVGVPGTVAGLWASHQRFGTLPWPELLEPAIKLAENGYTAPAWLAQDIADAHDRLNGKTNFSNYFGGVESGQVFAQPELAATLRRIATRGRDGFYQGETARLILQQMSRSDGLIRQVDLSNYEARWREPIRSQWREFEVVTAPPPSSGGIAILQYLAMKAALEAEFDGIAHNTPQYIHLKAEIEKRIFADRAQHLGDPDFIEIPMAELLSEAYLLARAKEINPERPTATGDVRARPEPMHTTHFSILDSAGNAVSNTYTLNTSFGSGVVVEGGGFLLNNEMDDFSAAPGQPNYYGVVGDEANAIAPGKRMLSSMSPTILLRDTDTGKEPAMVVGAMGGSTIFTTVYQIMSNIVEFGMSAAQAQSAPKVHHQLLPSQLITFSPSTPLPEATIEALQARGYEVRPHPWEFGNVQLIWVDENGVTTAAPDPRFAGTAWIGDPLSSGATDQN